MVRWGALLVAGCALAGSAAAQVQTPQIVAAIDGSITLAVAAGRNVTMQTYTGAGQTGTPDALVTASALAAELQLAATNAVETVQQDIVNAVAGVGANLTALAAAVSQGAAAHIAATASTNARISTLEAQVAQLVTAVPTSTNCPPYDVLAQGTVTGHGTHPGAIRLLGCGTGYALAVGGVPSPDAQSTVVCQASGQWSDGGATQCVRQLTTSPTAAPTAAPPEVVTCCIVNDDRFVAAYADGVRLTWRTAPGPRHSAVGAFQFASNTRVLGVHTADGECGCLCGYTMITCSTPSGTTRWDTTSPSTGWINDTAANTATFRQRWTVKTVAQRTSQFNSALLQIGNTWATPAFTAANLSANGFVTPTTEIPFGQYRRPNSNDPLQRGVGRFYSVLADRAPGTPAVTMGCPAVVTNQTNHYDNTANRLGALCGGLIYRNSTRSRYDWFFRVQMA